MVAAVAVAVVPAALVAVLPGSSVAQPLGSIQAKINSTRGKLDRARNREGVLTTDITALSGRIRVLGREIAALRRRESKVENTLAARRAQLVRVRGRFRREHVRYVRLRQRLRRTQGILARRLVAIYKGDQPDFVTLVLEADGFRNMLERVDYMSRIGEQDAAIVDRVGALKRQSARKRALLATLKQRAQAAVRAIAAKRRELARARGAIQSREGRLAGARRQKRGALGGVRASRRKLEGQLAALEAASLRVTAQLQAPGRLPAGPIKRGSGRFIWPVNGPVVSPFGPRWGRLHAGIDISAPGGTAIRAAGSGRVAIAGWMGGYGQYTCIRSGGGIATCYAHQSSIAVTVGQSVRQGQVIGAVGCTGSCTGDHVHFEVRVNGTPVNPLGYL